MKEIVAIIQPRRIQATKDALTAAEIDGMHAFACFGHGQGQLDPQILSAAQTGNPEAIALLGQHPPLVPKRTLTLLVDDDQVDGAVEAILQANQTGEHGDGKIYVCPVVDVRRIRTGEHGEDAL